MLIKINIMLFINELNSALITALLPANLIKYCLEITLSANWEDNFNLQPIRSVLLD
jgi:hypothetical protein